MKQKFPLLFTWLCCCAGPLLAQNADSTEQQLPLPAGLTAVPAFGQLEIVLFNTIATYRTELPPSSPFSEGRGNTFESILQTQYGFTRSNRLSAGFDLYTSHYRYGPATENSAFAPFGGASPGGIAAHGITQVGLKARAVPFVNLPQLTLQGRVAFPTLPAGNLARTLLGYDRTGAQLQAGFLQLVAPRLYGYAQVEWGAQFENKHRVQTTWNLPLQLFALYRLLRQADRSVAVFGGIGQTTFYEKQYKGGLTLVSLGRYWAVGGQWQLSRAFGLSLAYQGALDFDDNTPIPPGSYRGINLNLRYLYQ